MHLRWHWFGLHLDGIIIILMLYAIWRHIANCDPSSSGTLVLTDERWLHLQSHEFKIEAKAYRESPKSGGQLGWHVFIPAKGIALEVMPVMDDQEPVLPVKAQRPWTST